MEQLFEILSKFSPGASLIFSIVILIIALLLKADHVIKFYEWITKKQKLRTCGDCVLILFGIREKYESESAKLERSILRSQMSYFEQKIQEIILWLTQSYQDDIELLGHNKPATEKVMQFGYYQEALKTSLHAVKDEVRKAFKENGFVELSDTEFSIYVKSKIRTLISIAKSYLSTYYIQNENTIVTLKYRFEKLDYSRLNEIAFDVFGNARSIVKETQEKDAKLKEAFKSEINNFIKNK